MHNNPVTNFSNIMLCLLGSYGTNYVRFKRNILLWQLQQKNQVINVV